MLATASNQVLAARSCDWNPRYHGAATPVLRTDGTLANDIAATRSVDGGILPTDIENPRRTAAQGLWPLHRAD